MHVLHLDRVFAIDNACRENANDPKGIKNVGHRCPKSEVTDFGFQMDVHTFEEKQYYDGEYEKAFDSRAWPGNREGCCSVARWVYGSEEWHGALRLALYVSHACRVAHQV